jgi:CxxC-x17-CxxC domain-containing protein
MTRYPIRCSNCGGRDSVPFKPRPGGAPLLCGVCFKVKRNPEGLPPMPTDPRYCRWCNARRRLPVLESPVEGWPCPNGCAPNHDVPFTRRCAECQVEFRSGSVHQDLCWFHHRREMREIAQMSADESLWFNRPGSYTGDKTRDRVSARAYLMYLEEKEEAGSLTELERTSLVRLRERRAMIDHARSS